MLTNLFVIIENDVKLLNFFNTGKKILWINVFEVTPCYDTTSFSSGLTILYININECMWGITIKRYRKITSLQNTASSLVPGHPRLRRTGNICNFCIGPTQFNTSLNQMSVKQIPYFEDYDPIKIMCEMVRQRYVIFFLCTWSNMFLVLALNMVI